MDKILKIERDGYLKRAMQIYERGMEELQKAHQKKDEDLARDACGKGWIAIIEATKGFLLAKGVKRGKLPETQRGFQYFLRRYGDRELRRLYYAAYGSLHIDGYYDGIIDYNFIAERFEDVKRYIEIVWNVLR